MQALSLWFSGLVLLAVVGWQVLLRWWQLSILAELCLASQSDCAVAIRRTLSGLPLAIMPDAAAEEAESFSAGLARLPQVERRARTLPIAAMHVPKCGGTFGNALLRLPGACPELPPGELLCSVENPSCDMDSFLRRHGFADSRDLGLLCSGMSLSWGSHEGIASRYEALRGRLMTVLREPGQQLISGFFDGGLSWPHGAFARPPRSVREYAEHVQGFAVKMLTRDGRAQRVGNVVLDGRRPTVEETRLAVRRLREGFAFVGITEEFALTVCLFHTMFGGQCDHSEVRVFHAGPRYTGERYSEELLEGFRDVHGGAVYEAAQRIFTENLRIYNVSWETCGECFKQARLA